jgi:hypothetical protein
MNGHRKIRLEPQATDSTIPFQGCATDTKLPHQPWALSEPLIYFVETTRHLLQSFSPPLLPFSRSHTPASRAAPFFLTRPLSRKPKGLKSALQPVGGLTAYQGVTGVRGRLELSSRFWEPCLLCPSHRLLLPPPQAHPTLTVLIKTVGLCDCAVPWGKASWLATTHARLLNIPSGDFLQLVI